jgi:cellulose synthase/poly-beta-1,6-N-acetylglucosamine synthase-like glycosyltransferase
MSLYSFDEFSTTGSRMRDERGRVDRRRVEAASRSVGLRLGWGVGLQDAAQRSLPTEIAFLAGFGVPMALLQYATQLARRQGVSADAALLGEGLMEEEAFYRALADHLGVEFLSQAFEIRRPIDSELALKQGCARLAADPDGLVWLFAPKGEAIVRLMGSARASNGRPLFAITTPDRFIVAVRWEALRLAAAAAPLCAERADPALCVRRALGRRVLAFAIVANAALLAALFAPYPALALAAALPLATAFLSAIFLRLFACAQSFEPESRAPPLAEARLPIYTLIVPLYREAGMALQLARAIDRLDYPRAKLDVIFVVEQDDQATALALRRSGPRAPHQILIAPDGAPRTKPRAMNIAAPFARGALLAVFDAEDMPEPRQLRRAASLFARLPTRVACLQASLCIDNGAQNWLAAYFALDYAALFDVFNKGLSAMGLPIFLGGTSNHFRMEALREIGFWDAYNVTEDADLGLRLARAGYVVKTFGSQTFEEAPLTLKALLDQRARWLKGWMQTALVHCLNPRRLFKDLGARSGVAALAMFTGGFAGPLLFPFLTTVFCYRAAFGDLLTPRTPLELALSTLWCFTALSGLVAMIWLPIVGMRRRGLTRFWPALLGAPLWQLMLSVAAWRALAELWARPFHWQKTEHGLAARVDPVSRP